MAMIFYIKSMHSDSPSVKSKGTRLVSASVETKHIIIIGNRGKANQTPFCTFTISGKLKDRQDQLMELL